MNPQAEKKALKYNFKRPDRVSKNQIRSLHSVHDRFARNFSASVSAYLRTVVDITLENVAQTSYAEFLGNVADPTCFVGISLKPLDGLGAVELSPGLVFPMIDRLLGGLGRPIAHLRPMTEIEQSIISSVLKLMVDNLKESWRQLYSIDFAVAASETHPHMLQITAPSEMVIHCVFQVRMGESITKMHLAIPTLVLDPIMHVFDQEEYGRKKIVHDDTMLQLLRSASVKVSVGTEPTSFPMQSLLSLRVGDTLVLDQRPEWPVIIKVAGKDKLHANANTIATSRAFAVTGYVRPGREEPINGYNGR